MYIKKPIIEQDNTCTMKQYYEYRLKTVAMVIVVSQAQYGAGLLKKIKDNKYNSFQHFLQIKL